MTLAIRGTAGCCGVDVAVLGVIGGVGFHEEAFHAQD
jgi:hypothetical protein